MTKPALDVLVVGGGIAGPTFAFWLHKLLPTAHITILERSPAPRLSGQAVDIRAAAVPIVERMGLIDMVKKYATTEQGIDFIGIDGKVAGSFPKSGDMEAQSFTSEFEILRGDFAKILYESTKSLPNISYIFDETITSITQTQTEKVEVTFKNHHPTQTYDLVVGADGQSSLTRRLIFNKNPKNKQEHLRRLGQYSAYFTLPSILSDTPFAAWYNAPHGRLILLRPDQYGTRRCYLGVTDSNLSRFDEIDDIMHNKGVEEQKKWFAKEFEGAGWQSERMVKGMMESDDFYMQEIAQVKMERWSEGRVVLVGDAAYCPSPISGVGTGAALVGSYILAGELSLHPDNISLALAQYEKHTRPFVESVQHLIPGAPQVANPQTETGIKVFNTVAWVLSHPFVTKFGGAMKKFYGWVSPAFGGTKWEVPVYGEGK
ncbi:hypothetical protein HK097_007333 [Rhizophlyctis rosea]|uniref:FAD-binding domain-containing protein n=1 Tax=Rhizophlyctis rosea TaxID=64517 RepID=A0AAD5SER2_9FUNG|nr:hypothetical protein HK097_007333 [Rhizophlyctis rosea]